MLGRSSVVPVHVPRPERLAWHKMLISELRARTSDKRLKDLEQAAVLFAVLAEREPSALGDAFRDLPSSVRRKTKTAARTVLARLEATRHERAHETLRELLS